MSRQSTTSHLPSEFQTVARIEENGRVVTAKKILDECHFRYDGIRLRGLRFLRNTYDVVTTLCLPDNRNAIDFHALQKTTRRTFNTSATIAEYLEGIRLRRC